MKLCLAFMFQNEFDWLRLHMPVWKRYPADGMVAVDGGSDDGGRGYLRGIGAEVFYRPWDWRPLEQENYVIEMAEQSGYDAILLTAPDELLFPADVQMIRDTLEATGKPISFPTYNFMKDRLHYAPEPPYYPDVHIRAWRLGQGIKHVNAIDSVPNVSWRDTQYLPNVHLYHYSGIKDRRYYAWKGANFHRVKDGLPPLTTPWQEHDPAPYPHYVPFTGRQPLDPHEIGVNAPLA